RIGYSRGGNARFPPMVEIIAAAGSHHRQRLVWRYAPGITRGTVTRPQFQVGQLFEILEKRLFNNAPCGRYRREKSVFVVGTEFTGTVHTGRDVQEEFIPE